MPPREVADRARRAASAAVDGRQGASTSPGPGFLNITLDAASAGELARTIVEAGAAYGRGDAEAGHRINLEFVSANPTGPIHLGGTRWAAVGDALRPGPAGLRAPTVTREYYFNDHGAQIDRFARSLLAAAKGEPAPEDGYAGRLHRRHRLAGAGASSPTILDLPDDEAQERFRGRRAST